MGQLCSDACRASSSRSAAPGPGCAALGGQKPSALPRTRRCANLALRHHSDEIRMPRPLSGPKGPGRGGAVPALWEEARVSSFFEREYKATELPRVYDRAAVDLYFSERPELVLRRLAQIGARLGSFLSGVGLARAAALVSAQGQGSPGAAGASERSRSDAESLAETLAGLGPTFVKLGQVLATRQDVVGPTVAEALSRLQDGAPPCPSDVARQMLREELRRDLDDVFSYLSQEPVASASLGQVYLGVLKSSGQTVAVKVQRPGAVDAVALDVYLLRKMLGAVRMVAGMSRDLGEIADAVGEALFQELDYECEGRNTEEFAAAHARVRGVSTARILWTYTSRRVLTSVWVQGMGPKQLMAVMRAGTEEHAGGEAESVPATSLATTSEEERRDAAMLASVSGRVPEGLGAREAPEWARARLLRMVNLGIECSLTQLMQTGVMHADPHPGNLLVDAEGNLVYLDLGMLTRVSDKHRLAMLTSFVHIVFGDWPRLADDLAAMDLLKPSTDRQALQADLARNFALYCGRAADGGLDVGEMSYGDVTKALARTALQHKFRLPPYYTLVVRSLATLEGVAAAADPGFRLYRAALPPLLRLVALDPRPEARAALRDLVEGELRAVVERREGAGPGGVPAGARLARLVKTIAAREAAGARRALAMMPGLPAALSALAWGPAAARAAAACGALLAGALARAVPGLRRWATRRAGPGSGFLGSGLGLSLTRVEARRLALVGWRCLARSLRDLRSLPALLAFGARVVASAAVCVARGEAPVIGALA